MGYVNWILKKYFPNKMHYEPAIKFLIDVVFFVVLVMMMWNARVTVIEVCPPLQNATANFTILPNVTVP